MENLEQKNPFTYELLGRASLREGDFAAAAAAFGSAEKTHDRVGDAIRARNAGADRALALLGAGDAAGSTETRRIFAQKSNPRTNNPDAIPLLQELSRKDAELHLALGAKLAAKGDAKDATALWETGCVRLRTYVDDATARIVADDVREGDDERGEAQQLARHAEAADRVALGRHVGEEGVVAVGAHYDDDAGSNSGCLLYTSPSPRDKRQSRMPSSA